MPPPRDAPYELASDSDRAAVRATFEALSPGADERAATRERLAAEYARRATAALEARKLEDAFASVRELLTLWRPAEIRAGAPGLAPHAGELRAAKARFARAGGDVEAVTLLAALAVVDDEHRGVYEAEIEEIFAFSDDLAIAEHGDGAQRARPIEILETAATTFPSPLVVDRLVALYRERQQAIDSLFRRSGADVALIQAHGESVLRTSWHIVRVLARAGRIDEAPAALASVHGIGDDARLRRELEGALRGDDALGWVRLAAAFRGEDGDLHAALALCREAIRRHPQQAAGYLAAGDTARALDSIPLAIRFYERGLALDPDHQEASSHLAGLYEYRVADLAFHDRPQAAKAALAELERFHARATRALDEPLEPDLASAYAAMGRGLVSLGELDEARRYLTRSLEVRPTLEALEHLGTVALKRGKFEDALRHLERALELPHDDLAARFQRIVLMRLAGESHAGAGREARAQAYLTAALRAWNQLTSEHELSRPYLAQSLVERGKLSWALDHREVAITAFETAVDVHPSGSALSADLVAFLLMRGEYRLALDIYHRAVGNAEVDNYFKVYMSLWVLAEAEARGAEPDPVARDFLDDRDGRLWYDALARLATGRAEPDELRQAATTRGRRAELLYYLAVLGSADPATERRLLQGVLDSGMVLFFEYEMAARRLAAAD